MYPTVNTCKLVNRPRESINEKRVFENLPGEESRDAIENVYRDPKYTAEMYKSTFRSKKEIPFSREEDPEHPWYFIHL